MLPKRRRVGSDRGSGRGPGRCAAPPDPARHRRRHRRAAIGRSSTARTASSRNSARRRRPDRRPGRSAKTSSKKKKQKKNTHRNQKKKSARVSVSLGDYLVPTDVEGCYLGWQRIVERWSASHTWSTLRVWWCCGRMAFYRGSLKRRRRGRWRWWSTRF